MGPLWTTITNTPHWPQHTNRWPLQPLHLPSRSLRLPWSSVCSQGHPHNFFSPTKFPRHHIRSTHRQSWSIKALPGYPQPLSQYYMCRATRMRQPLIQILSPCPPTSTFWQIQGPTRHIRIAITSTKHHYYPPHKQSWYSMGAKSHPR